MHKSFAPEFIYLWHRPNLMHQEVALCANLVFQYLTRSPDGTQLFVNWCRSKLLNKRTREALERALKQKEKSAVTKSAKNKVLGGNKEQEGTTPGGGSSAAAANATSTAKDDGTRRTDPPPEEAQTSGTDVDPAFNLLVNNAHRTAIAAVTDVSSQFLHTLQRRQAADIAKLTQAVVNEVKKTQKSFTPATTTVVAAPVVEPKRKAADEGGEVLAAAEKEIINSNVKSAQLVVQEIATLREALFDEVVPAILEPLLGEMMKGCLTDMLTTVSNSLVGLNETVQQLREELCETHNLLVSQQDEIKALQRGREQGITRRVAGGGRSSSSSSSMGMREFVDDEPKHSVSFSSTGTAAAGKKRKHVDISQSATLDQLSRMLKTSPPPKKVIIQEPRATRKNNGKR